MKPVCAAIVPGVVPLTKLGVIPGVVLMPAPKLRPEVPTPGVLVEDEELLLLLGVVPVGTS